MEFQDDVKAYFGLHAKGEGTSVCKIFILEKYNTILIKFFLV